MEQPHILIRKREPAASGTERGVYAASTDEGSGIRMRLRIRMVKRRERRAPAAPTTCSLIDHA